MDRVDDSTTLKNFLLSPDSHRKQTEFWKVCARIALGYFRMRSGASHAPTVVDSSPARTIADLATASLSSLLEPVDGKPFAKVFDFYHRQGVNRFSEREPRELYYLLTVLIRGHVKRYMYKGSRTEDSNFANIEKGFKQVFSQEPYARFASDTAGDYLVCLHENLDRLATDQPVVPVGELTEIVEKAWFESTTYPAWCKSVFESLSKTEYKQSLSERTLIKAAALARKVHMEHEIDRPHRADSPEHALEASRINACLRETLGYINEYFLSGFMKKGRLTEAESCGYLKAFETYIKDGLNSAECDGYPAYFRAYLPEDCHDRYLQDYKYTFETAFNGGKEFLRKRLNILQQTGDPDPNK